MVGISTTPGSMSATSCSPNPDAIGTETLWFGPTGAASASVITSDAERIYATESMKARGKVLFLEHFLGRRI